MNKILTILLLITINASAQSNWLANNSTRVPSTTLIESQYDVTLGGDFIWQASVPFINANHLCRLVWALPNSLDGLTATPKLEINGAIDTTAIFTILAAEVRCHFPSTAIFPPNTLLKFTLSNINVNDTISYINQVASHFIDFVAAPYETMYTDNISVQTFHTIAEGVVPMKIDTTEYDILPYGDTLLAYPNPFSSFLSLRYSLKKQYDVKVFIISVDGKMIKKEHFQPIGSGVFNIDLNHVSDGQYIVKVLLGGNLFFIKKFSKKTK